MPREIEIEFFRISETKVNAEEVNRWLRRLGADGFELPGEDEVTDPALLVALASKRCYMSFEPGLNPNVTRVRKDYAEYLDNILRSQHGSVLEHAVFSYAIEGVSRVFTGEMNRHRPGWAISEGSMRFIRFEEIPYWVPTSLRDAPDDDDDLTARKQVSRELFRYAFRQMERNYTEFMKIWDMNETDQNFAYKKKITSAARRVIGMGVATGGVWTGNVRALRHVISMRTDPAAEEEIFHVFSRIADDVIKREPMLFGDFSKIPEGGFSTAYWKV